MSLSLTSPFPLFGPLFISPFHVHNNKLVFFLTSDFFCSAIKSEDGEKKYKFKNALNVALFHITGVEPSVVPLVPLVCIVCMK